MSSSRQADRLLLLSRLDIQQLPSHLTQVLSKSRATTCHLAEGGHAHVGFRTGQLTVECGGIAELDDDFFDSMKFANRRRKMAR